jgi:hypothetical protein
MTETTLVLDVAALRKITQYAHWMPALRGISEEYIARNYPGWEWNEILPFLIKEKVVSREPGQSHPVRLNQGLSISREIKSVMITRTKNGFTLTINKANLRNNRESSRTTCSDGTNKDGRN